MLTYFAVRRILGYAWDASKTMREQALWNEHATFMDELAAEGFVVLGGPLGSGREILLIVNSSSESALRTRLDVDPWSLAGLLAIGSVERWTVLLNGQPAS